MAVYVTTETNWMEYNDSKNPVQIKQMNYKDIFMFMVKYCKILLLSMKRSLVAFIDSISNPGNIVEKGIRKIHTRVSKNKQTETLYPLCRGF